MKTKTVQCALLAVGLVAALTFEAGSIQAQDSNKSENLGTSQTAPQLSSVVAQVVQLSKANVGEETIISFVNNSENNDNLDATQIIYLKQQGVSDNVVNSLIKRQSARTPAASVAPALATYTNIYTVAQSPKAAASSPNTQTNYAVMQPVTAIYETAPPYYYPYYYYPYGYYWPPVALSFRFGGGWHGGHRR